MYSKEIRKSIFVEEVSLLEKKKLIDDTEKNSLLEKYEIHYAQLIKVEKEKALNIETEKESERKEIARRLQQEREEKKLLKKQKKALSAEQVRERNITWMLILGTLLLLLGGLVLATNSWDQMTPLLKALSIAFVAAFFYGLSFISEKKLKIDKTAFAFLVLGSLFIPITVISAGYFELFGTWFSLSGEGKYLFFAIGLGFTIPVYLKHAISQQSSFYVWVSYIMLSLTVSFFIASFYPSKDLFYIGVLLFNVGLLYTHYKIKNKGHIFTKDLPKYAQGNLALSTLLLIFIFNQDEALFGMNLILTAFVYLFVLYAGKRKENHFIFSILLIYGFYMLIENTALRSFDLALFASIGFVFIGLSKKIINESKILQYTSAFVSFCSFIFVTGKAVFMYSEHTTLLLAISYLLISLNYGYLAYEIKNQIFKYTTIFFLTLSGTQIVWQIDNMIDYSFAAIGYFILGLMLYVILYLYNHWKYTITFKLPSLVFSLLMMIFGIVNIFNNEKWYETILLLSIFSYVSYQISRLEEKVKHIFVYVSALSIYGSLITIYPILMDYIWYKDKIALVGHIAFVTVLGVGLSSILEMRNKHDLSSAINWAGIIIYFWSVSILIEMNMNLELMLPIYFAIGTYLTARMGHKTTFSAFWYVSGVNFIFTYYAFILKTVNLPLENALIFLAFSPLLLIVASKIYKKQYFIVAQMNTFLLLAFTLIFFIDNMYVFIVITCLYVYGFNVINRFNIKLLYLLFSLTMIPIIGYSTLVKFSLINNYINEIYLLFISSAIYLWLTFTLKNWKSYIKYYNIAFSLLSNFYIFPALFLYFISPEMIIVMLGYLALTVYITTFSRIHFLALAPLLLSVFYVQQLTQKLNFSNIEIIITYIVMFIIVKIIGEKRYEKLFEYKIKSLDVFTVAAFIYILMMYYTLAAGAYRELHFVIEMIPSLLIVYFFYSQINRIDGKERLIQTITYISILLPYYKLLDYIAIPKLIETEVEVLPFLILVIFLSRKTWQDKGKWMNNIQWIILIVTSGLLVQDALESNTIYDAFIIGALSLSFILYGFFMRLKSYLLVGSVVLLLTILIQTRPFWGNMPWWIYLIVAGTILISVGSYHEWKKQKGDTKSESKWKSLWKQMK